jgi:hypothetical protein
MGVKYIRITEGVDAGVHNGYLYVKQTDMQFGMLVEGGYADRVYRIPYIGTLDDALVTNEWGISDINRCIEDGTIVRKGRVIH